jgi:hypothetical protein
MSKPKKTAERAPARFLPFQLKFAPVQLDLGSNNFLVFDEEDRPYVINIDQDSGCLYYRPINPEEG